MAANTTTNSDVRTSPGPRPRVTFIMPPPPITLFVELNNGMHVSMPFGFAPTSNAFLTSLMGLQELSGTSATPMQMRMPGMMFFGTGGLDRSMEEGLMRVLHDLFLLNQAQQTGPPPTSRAFLDALPVKTWNVESAANEKHCDCSICLCDYEVNDQVLPLPCGHQFHKDCGVPWLIEHNVCPTCRYELPTIQSEALKPAAEASVPVQAPTTSSTVSATTTPLVAEPEAEPEAEPDAQDDVVTTQSRIRQRSPRRESIRAVRRRLSENESIVLPNVVGSSNDEDALDSLLEEAATSFVAEELNKQRQMDIDLDDVDVEELLQDASQ